MHGFSPWWVYPPQKGGANKPSPLETDAGYNPDKQTPPPVKAASWRARMVMHESKPTERLSAGRADRRRYLIGHPGDLRRAYWKLPDSSRRIQ